MAEREIPEQQCPEKSLVLEWQYQAPTPITLRENRQWLTAVAYYRYAGDFVISIKGNKTHAAAIREECRALLEGTLKLMLNADKTHITHVTTAKMIELAGLGFEVLTTSRRLK